MIEQLSVADKDVEMGVNSASSTARGELPEEIGPLLERHRDFLMAIAAQELPAQLVCKVGVSDLVQETLVKGYEHFESFGGTSREQLAAWLRQILRNHLKNVIKSFHSERRDVAREQSVDLQIVREPTRTPSEWIVSREQWEQFNTALSRLPDELRRVILWRHQDDRSFVEIGHLLAKSEDTARRLWVRAVRQLHRELHIYEPRLP